jgi:hypothetical protein
MAYGTIDSRAEKSCSYMHDATLMFIIYVRNALSALFTRNLNIYIMVWLGFHHLHARHQETCTSLGV